ncbi:DUF3431 domain-containing protein [Sandarakinorhabdus rubra]|uniref:DUF3431 domain-containing protein n=1 Tax=Sandarakinorhabdus rubra TaxID=2672568 RepID=UPI0013D9AAEF|nr:DUF3431 domain-containing protein [Sandarakinorhabdus rubra]
MQVDLVVARYNEDLAWLGRLGPSLRIFIYNKGPQLCPQQLAGGRLDLTVEALPNVGRESHSYLHHIVSRRDTLGDVTIFVQGRIDDVGKNVFADLADYVAPALADGYCASDLEFHFPLFGSDSDIRGKLLRNPRYREALETGQLAAAGLEFNSFARQLLGRLPPVMVTSFQGCFAVSRAAVHQHQPEFYRGLLEELARHPNPEIGHYMERLWCSIFSGTSLRRRAALHTLAKARQRLAIRPRVRRLQPQLLPDAAA